MTLIVMVMTVSNRAIHSIFVGVLKPVRISCYEIFNPISGAVKK